VNTLSIELEAARRQGAYASSTGKIQALHMPRTGSMGAQFRKRWVLVAEHGEAGRPWFFNRACKSMFNLVQNVLGGT
jgi:hypothetical protein